jgi:UDP-2,4-diacetamido-2,4,6-trideoxy-beta-L-altropyranose hydrolase
MAALTVVFRADASLQIGTGHIMRCLSLADALKARGARCHFMTREHPGNLIEHLRLRGYDTHVLPCPPTNNGELSPSTPGSGSEAPVHIRWLGTTQQRDAQQCEEVLRRLQPDWVIVDHYALDSCWEQLLRPFYQQLMVIDDLADRPHCCDLLLDQTFGRERDDYTPLLPEHCITLCGAQFALLRPEFAALRAYSLARRQSAPIENLLVTMGGVDNENATGMVLQALSGLGLPQGCRVTVVMGAKAPWLQSVRQQAEQSCLEVDVRVGVADMAALMANADLAIGAAGSTSWERCCLGVPTVMIVLADNQREVAKGLERVGAAKVIHEPKYIASQLPDMLGTLLSSSEERSAMSHAAASVADGSGLSKVIDFLEQ